MNSLEFAKQELGLAGLFSKDSDYEGMIGEDVLELMKVFAKQGHSGFSAKLTAQIFGKLTRYEPLTPLRGSDDEWTEVRPGVFQNNRCPRVFKENGQAYDTQGRVFRDSGDTTFISGDSRVLVSFPYTPTTKIVDYEDKSK
mgnify:FL=1